MEDKRQSIRTPLVIEVHIRHNAAPPIVGVAMNVSEGGAMVKAAGLSGMLVGQEVFIRTWNGQEFGPEIQARIAWRDDDLTGLRFFDTEESDA